MCDMANLKVGKQIFDINEKDIIVFNGASWILKTRKVKSGWYDCSPSVSKILCERLLKKNILILIKKKDEYITADGQQMGTYYYKFDVNKLEEFNKQ